MVDAPAPLWVNADPMTGQPTNDAQQLRLSLAALIGNGSPRPLGARSGVRPGTGTVSVSGTTVTVDPVQYVIDPAVTTTQGPYPGAVADATTFMLQAADSTNARKDIVYLRVSDTDVDGSGARKAEVLYAAGVPAQTPVAPTLPDRSLLLATIDVPALNNGEASVTQANQFAVASGGILPVRDVDDIPADLTDGAFASSYAGPGLWQMVGGVPRAVDDDSGWINLASANVSAWNLGTGDQAPAVRRQGQWVYVTGRWSRNDSFWVAGQASPVVPSFIPPEFAPSGRSFFGTATAGAGYCQLEITTAGEIQLSYPTTNTQSGSRVWLSATYPAS